MELRTRLKESLPALLEAKEAVEKVWNAEDLVYRFYHQSFKAYDAQSATKYIVHTLQNVVPERTLDPSFLRIVRRGTRKTWTPEANARWEAETRPIIEALFHARYFLDMAVKYAQDDPFVPFTLASKDCVAVKPGYAALLELYGMR